MLLFALNIVIVSNLIFFVYLWNIIIFILIVVVIIASIIPFVGTVLVFIVLFITIIIIVLLVIITTIILFKSPRIWRRDVKPSFVVTFYMNYVTAIFNEKCTKSSDCGIENGACWRSKECGWSVCSCQENHILVALDRCVPGRSARNWSRLLFFVVTLPLTK